MGLGFIVVARQAHCQGGDRCPMLLSVCGPSPVAEPSGRANQRPFAQGPIRPGERNGTPQSRQDVSGDSGLSRAPARRATGHPAVACEVEGAVGPEFDSFSFQQSLLEARWDVGHPVGGTASRSVDDTVPGNPSRASMHRPADCAWREAAAQQGRDLAVGHDAAPGDAPDLGVDGLPAVPPAALDLAMDPSLASPPAQRREPPLHRVPSLLPASVCRSQALIHQECS
jgi:hypothetical protein